MRETNVTKLIILIRWIILSVVLGILLGLVGTAFYYCLQTVTNLRQAHPAILLTLPFIGLVIVWMYHISKNENDTGTNLVLSAIHSGNRIPLRMAPLIFLSTMLTHLGGGSAGREGAALQLGGSIGNAAGQACGLEEDDRHIMIMCGMSAAFSALFGTPMAAAIFPMEVVSVGIMHYSALVPCVISSLTAHAVASALGVAPELFPVTALPDFTVMNASLIGILAFLCAMVSVLFCVMLHTCKHLYTKYIANPYLRAFVGGCIILLLTALVGNQNYNGAGFHIVADCMKGEIAPEAFFLKIMFTALTLGAGFKGGEIVPTFYIGAAFGCLFGNIIGFSPMLCTAIGMCAVFCGVTNAPISTLLISFELFGFEGMPFYLLAIALSYMLSGYYGLYNEQKIVYSKFKTSYINQKTR